MFHKTSVNGESETRGFQKGSSNLKLRSYGPRVKEWNMEAGRKEAEGPKEVPQATKWHSKVSGRTCAVINKIQA